MYDCGNVKVFRIKKMQKKVKERQESAILNEQLSLFGISRC